MLEYGPSRFPKNTQPKSCFESSYLRATRFESLASFFEHTPQCYCEMVYQEDRCTISRVCSTVINKHPASLVFQSSMTFAPSKSAATSSSKTTKTFENSSPTLRLLLNRYDVLKKSSIWLYGGSYCRDKEIASISR